MQWRTIEVYVVCIPQLKELGVTASWVLSSFTILQLYQKLQSFDITFEFISVKVSLLLELYGTKT